MGRCSTRKSLRSRSTQSWCAFQARRVQLCGDRTRCGGTRGCGTRSKHRTKGHVNSPHASRMNQGDAPLAGNSALIDAHAHFYHSACGRSDWERVNAARLRAGDRIGITYHVASVLGSFGHTSPTYFPSPADVSVGNDAMAQFANDPRIKWYVTVNPNYTDHALAESERGVERGAIGVKLLASRRADDP